MATREEIIRKIAENLSKAEEFKDFHGKIQLNFSHGECKNHSIEQTFIKK